MPPKIKTLIKKLTENGFVERGGKGSHRNFSHPRCAQTVTISGKLNEDAKKYQEKIVAKAIQESKQ
jgi:predicted RNA binding protein YcfA (HicA-like mRNA interferase family)